MAVARRKEFVALSRLNARRRCEGPDCLHRPVRRNGRDFLL
jgi:hypothetical protein